MHIFSLSRNLFTDSAGFESPTNNRKIRADTPQFTFNPPYFQPHMRDLPSAAHTLPQELNQFGVDLALWDLSNDADVQDMQRRLRQMALRHDTPAAVQDALETGIAQLAAWASLARTDNTATMYDLCQWYEETELLCAVGVEPQQQADQGPQHPPASPKLDSADATGETGEAGVTGATAASGERITLNVARDADLLREFCDEASELLNDIEQGLLTLEVQPNDHDVLNAIFRAFHTFKGGAGMLKLGPIQHVAHQLESILDEARTGRLQVDANVISLILQAADHVGSAVADIVSALDAPQSPDVVHTAFHSQALLANVQRVLNGEAFVQTQDTVPARHTLTSPSKPANPETTPTQAPTPTPTPITPAPAPSAQAATASVSTGARNTSNKADASIKVGAGKLDELIDLVGELMIAQSMVTQHPMAVAIASDSWDRAVRQLLRITKDLQRTTMAVRMVPVSNSFKKMARLVRDLSASQGKQATLVLKGESTELDRSIVDALAEPLAHMVRNAVDHGLELPAEREANGKPACGSIELRAYQHGGAFVVQLADDGRGLSRERIRNKAVALGLIQSGQELADDDLFALVFAAGFSTAANVTDVSGRGVGMDVVRQSIAALRGKVEISSQEGTGTTVTITLPLTMAIIDGLVVVVGQERFILPALMVRECLRPDEAMLGRTSTQGEVVRIREQLIPIVRLSHQLGIPNAHSNPAQGILVVVETGRSSVALLVDQLLDKQELVIKSLGASFQDHPMFSGAAVLGDGLVSCILNVDALAAPHAKRAPTANPAANPTPTPDMRS
jgi:two-component system, chemotaxis family, sensor kinase CheA